MKNKIALFLFHRDLRLTDNSGLLRALENSEKVIPCFILNPVQLKNNPYRSDNAVQFMIESLIDLNEQLNKVGSHLEVLEGETNAVLETLFKTGTIQALYTNRDYTPFAQKRDQAIESLCKQYNIAFFQESDALLTEPEQVRKPNGEPYTVFTPFFKRASKISIREPKKNAHKNYLNQISEKESIDRLKKHISNHSNIHQHGGSREAKKRIDRLGELRDYAKTRNNLAERGTSLLSPHHKFGTVSIREVYYAVLQQLGPESQLFTELFWRDFLTHIAFHFPHVFGREFKEKYQHIKWNANEEWFQKWCEGKTGFPIIDAGMRELNQTGAMHNRARMITASFLVKDLQINWQWGEKYFAQKLIDYDPCVNNGNWQWAASTGCDAQPYFRIFNPLLQQKRFDPKAEYVKRWVPELRSLNTKEIEALYGLNAVPPNGYVPGMVNHAEAVIQTKALFKKCGY
ncbi:deoxyribodipyrimidine photo-lyase [Candidatus Peregrinibacteria bacterium]|nr:MAG: deoxyribodipyrimidine photo-lyase [Candidatus Peregrinibacteria bacterium]